MRSGAEIGGGRAAGGATGTAGASAGAGAGAGAAAGKATSLSPHENPSRSRNRTVPPAACGANARYGVCDSCVVVPAATSQTNTWNVRAASAT
jgi:hypothetical protein